jgi:preprotein translocase subunit SecG
MCLWVDQMFNGLFGVKGVHSDLYKASHFIVFLLLVPWLVLVSISQHKD